MKEDSVYLEHILEAIEDIEGYIGVMGYEDFKDNKMVADAVIRKLEIIGEAANNLSEKFVKDNPDMPFHDAIDMRNFLVHEYFGVSSRVVWDTCKDDLPELKKFVKIII